MTKDIRDYQDIVARLGKLERQNRWLKRVGLAVLLGAAATLLMGQASPKRILTAQEYLLLDSRSEVRARLWMSPAGPSLVFYDMNGQGRTVVGFLDSGPVPGPNVILNDMNERPRASLHVYPEGTGLMLFDQLTNPRLWLSIGDAQPAGASKSAIPIPEGPTLRFFDGNGTARVAVGQSTETNSAALTLQDANGNPRIDLRVRPEEASFFLFDADRKPIFSKP